MNFVPLALYAVAFAAYAWHFARRNPAVGHAATTLLVAGALAHTFVIGMQTMEAGHVPITSASTAISTFVWLLALAYLYIEMATDERAMGVFILPLLVALQTIPAMNPAVEARSTVLQGWLFGLHVSSLLFAYASFALACVIGSRASPLQEIKQSTGILLRASVAAGARPHEPTGHRHRMDFSDRRPDCRRHVYRRGAALPSGPRSRACRRCRSAIQIFVRFMLGGYSFELFAARRIGWGGRRTAYSRRLVSRSCC